MDGTDAPTPRAPGPAPRLAGLHHVSFPVADLDAGCAWYERVLGGERVPDLDHHDADGRRSVVVLEVPGLTTLLQLRLDPPALAGARTFEAVTLGVDDPAQLQAWVERLDALGVEHEPVRRRMIGTSVTATTPDGAPLTFYTVSAAREGSSGS